MRSVYSICPCVCMHTLEPHRKPFRYSLIAVAPPICAPINSASTCTQRTEIRKHYKRNRPVASRTKRMANTCSTPAKCTNTQSGPCVFAVHGARPKQNFSQFRGSLGNIAPDLVHTHNTNTTFRMHLPTMCVCACSLRPRFVGCCALVNI